MMFVKLPAVKKFCAVWLKTSTTIARAPRITGQLPRFPGAHAHRPRARVSGASRSRARPRGRRVWLAHAGCSCVPGIPDDLRRRAGRDRVHDLLLGRLRALEDADVLRPSRSTVIRSAASKTSWRLCEIITTPRPCSASRCDEREHLLGLRDAERGRRLVEDDEPRVPHHRARDRDRLALPAGERRDRPGGST